MYTGAGVAKLRHAAKALRDHWDATEGVWNDTVRKDFETDHLQPILSQAEAGLRAMQELADILARVYRECS